MALTQDQLLNKLDGAFKAAVDITDAGDAILNPQQFDRFVQTIEAGNVLLGDARFMKMEEAKVNIDRIAMSGRVLYSGQDNSSAVRTLTDAEKRKPTISQNQLVAQEFQTATGVYDRTLRRIIERDNFSNTLIEMISTAAGRDLEELAIFGDTSITYATDSVLHQTDAWVKEAGNKLYYDDPDNAGTLFDVDGDDAPVDMFDAMIDELDKKYLENPDNYTFYVNWAVADGYRDWLGARNTTLGDTVITQGLLPAYKGIKVKYLPRLSRSTSVADNRVGQVAMLQNPDNMCWGVFHEVTIEPDRVPAERKTDYYLTVEADAKYEDEDAAVVAFMEIPNPA